ncbi:hypothetical protein Tco_0919353 [Tanacetum coccineum]
MSHTNLSQQTIGSSQQPSQEIQEEDDEMEPVPTQTSKKPDSQELLLAECFIQISEDPRVGSDQKNDTFWYKIRDAYNEQAAKKGFTIRTKNMLTRKWTPMNRDVGKFNSLYNETKAMSRENDENLMTRIKILRNRNRVTNTNEEPELFGDDALPRPPGMHKIANSQRSSNSTTSSGSNLAMFQEMTQQQLEIERNEKMERIDREVNSRVALNDSKRVVEDLKVLQISTDGMDPIDAAIVNAQKARIRALYHSNN